MVQRELVKQTGQLLAAGKLCGLDSRYSVCQKHEFPQESTKGPPSKMFFCQSSVSYQSLISHLAF